MHYIKSKLASFYSCVKIRGLYLMNALLNNLFIVIGIVESADRVTERNKEECGVQAKVPDRKKAEGPFDKNISLVAGNERLP